MKWIYKIFFLGLFSLAKAQYRGADIDTTGYRHHAISAQLGGPTLALAVNYAYYLNDKLSFDIGGGFFGIYGGVKYYFGNGSHAARIVPYLGGFITDVTVFNNFTDSARVGTGIYFPLGIQITSKKSFVFAVEVAYININPDQKTNFWGAVKYGYRF